MAYTVIDKPSDYFNTVLYTGNGGTNSVTSLDFQPNFVWIKNRSHAGYNHALFDSVRSATKVLKSNLTDIERTLTDSLTAFNSNGFSLGADADNTYGNTVNQNAKTYASWNWRTGTSFTNDASATGIGTLDSTGSVNTDAGFSIVSWTAGSGVSGIAHGLGGVPDLIISKDRDAASGWIVGSHLINNWDSYLNLTNTSTLTSDVRMYHPSGQARPSSTIFFQDHAAIGSSGEKMIAYCFRSIKGYSKFSSYIGNGQDTPNGVFTYLGFTPAFILIKATDDNSWVIVDNKRPADSNPVDDSLAADSTAAETTGDSNTTFDFLSNGFRTNGNSGNNNSSGQEYIFMAFAEQPFVSSTGVPATAR